MTFLELVQSALPVRVIQINTGGVTPKAGLNAFIIDKTDVVYAETHGDFERSIVDQVKIWYKAQSSVWEVIVVEREKTWALFYIGNSRDGR